VDLNCLFGRNFHNRTPKGLCLTTGVPAYPTGQKDALLLRQPHGFEDLTFGLEGLDPDHEAVSDCVHVPKSPLHLRSACLAPATQPETHDDVVSRVDERLWMGFESLERLQPFPPELSHTLVTVIGVVLELKRAGVVLPNDVRVVERKQCLRVVALHRRPNTTDDLYVLLRHRPRSIPQRQESA
jgi:hypothetical protein